jgi:hypothetical protein
VTRYHVAQAFFLACVAAAPLLKAFLVRRGTATPLAYTCGFALLAVAVLTVRLARG